MAKYESIEMHLVRGEYWPRPETITEHDSLEEAFHGITGAEMILPLDGYTDRWIFVPRVDAGAMAPKFWSVYPPGGYWHTLDRSGSKFVDDEFHRIMGGIR